MDIYLKSVSKDLIQYLHIQDECPVRQINIRSGGMHFYTTDQWGDQFGFLCDQPLSNFDPGWEKDLISAAEFECEWLKRVQA